MENFDFDKVAKLSRLEFSDTEKQSFINDMHEMLCLASSLCAVDKEELQKNTYENIISTSPDEQHDDSCGSLVLQSKRHDGTFVRVPSSLE